MRVKFMQLFVSTFKENLQKLANKSGRIISAMDIEKVTTNEKEIELPIGNNRIEQEDNSSKKEPNLVSKKQFTRYRQRCMKRQWDETPKKEDQENGEKKLCQRIKLKKMVLLLGYCGVDYYGMQSNPGVKTIEEELFKALHEVKYIKEEDLQIRSNLHFQRSSRTDKGVSAARQIVSLKLPLEVDINEINKRLPESIKVFGVKRVTNRFNSKGKCDARTYSYTLPTYVFESSLETEEQRKKYRISAEKMVKIHDVLAYYKGTKNYHNFTVKKYFEDPSARRYMINFNVDKVFVECDMEFTVLSVKGQSFMLHQIRKMVGLVIAVVRGHTDMGTVERAFTKEKVLIPTAPGLGLVLDMVHFDRYDAKHKDSHATLTWEAEEKSVEEFKHSHIYPVIFKGEIEDNSMGQWLSDKLQRHKYEPCEATDETNNEDEVTADGDDDGDADDDENDEKVDDEKVNDENVNEKVNDEKVNDENVNEKVNDEKVDDEKVNDENVNDENVNEKVNDENVNEKVNDEKVNDEKIDDEKETVDECKVLKTDSV